MLKRSTSSRAGNSACAVLPAAGEQVREQRLEHREALGVDRRRRAVDLLLDEAGGRGREPLRLALVALADEPKAPRDLAPQLFGGLRHRSSVLAQHPGGQERQARVVGHEDAVLDATAVAVRPLDPPRGVAADLDSRLADRLADLPGRTSAVAVDVEIGRQAEVPLAAGREADLASDARDAEGALLAHVEVLADDVPGTCVLEERVRVDRALAFVVARDRPVGELDRALLRDRSLELAEPALHLDRVLGVEHLDAHGGLRRRLREARAAEREVLEREPERLGIGELPLEQVEAGLQRGELLVGQLERRQEVALRAHVVELLAGVLVPLGVEGDAECEQLRPVGVEPAREGLVRHLLVALDAALDVAGGDRSPLRHQERDQRELADQLVSVVGQPAASLSAWEGVTKYRPCCRRPS